MCADLTDYRGYTMRKKRWAPDMERKIKDVLNIAKTPDEAVQYLKQQNLDNNDVALIMQRFYPNYSSNLLLAVRADPNGVASSQRIPLSSHEQQLELIGFSQSVSVMAPNLLFTFDRIFAMVLNYTHTHATCITSFTDSHAEPRCS